MENRAGLIVQDDLAHADGHADRKAALDMVHRQSPGSTRQLPISGKPASRLTSRRNREIPRSTVEPPGTKVTPCPKKHRKRIDEAFGWAKTVGGMAQTVYRGRERVRSRFILTMAANIPARLPRFLAA